MIAGRLRWRDRGTRIPRKLGLAAFDFSSGTLLMTEAGSIKRAALHLVAGRDGLREHDRGGIEVLASDLAAFRDALVRENHTLKRSLTDPRLFSGIGNAYSDEILHAAGLSPRQADAPPDRSGDRPAARRDADDAAGLDRTRLRREAGDRFPEQVTAFHPGMAVHGRYGKPCPGMRLARCSASSTRATSRTTAPPARPAGSCSPTAVMSRLLKGDWPRSLDEWEAMKEERNATGAGH